MEYLSIVFQEVYKILFLLVPVLVSVAMIVWLDRRIWDEFTKKDDVVVIDTRNKYEIEIGTFKGSINPDTDSFKKFPGWWEKIKA